MCEFAQRGALELVRAALEAGADVHIHDDAAVRFAAGNGHLDTVRYLIDKGNAHACALGNDAFFRALDADHLHVAEYLIERGVVNVRDVVEVNRKLVDDGYSALRWVSEKGSCAAVRMLVKHGANMRARDDMILRLAAHCGHLDVVEYLLDQGANAHAQEYDALCRSASTGCLDVVRLLLDRAPASVNIRQDMPLRIAAKHGHLDVVKELIERGANVSHINIVREGVGLGTSNTAIRYTPRDHRFFPDDGALDVCAMRQRTDPVLMYLCAQSIDMWPLLRDVFCRSLHRRGISALHAGEALLTNGHMTAARKTLMLDWICQCTFTEADDPVTWDVLMLVRQLVRGGADINSVRVRSRRWSEYLKKRMPVEVYEFLMCAAFPSIYTDGRPIQWGARRYFHDQLLPVLDAIWQVWEKAPVANDPELTYMCIGMVYSDGVASVYRQYHRRHKRVVIIRSQEGSGVPLGVHRDYIVPLASLKPLDKDVPDDDVDCPTMFGHMTDVLM